MQLRRAKILFMQDGDSRKGFEYDHVWHMIKDMEKKNEGRHSDFQTS